MLRSAHLKPMEELAILEGTRYWMNNYAGWHVDFFTRLRDAVAAAQRAANPFARPDRAHQTPPASGNVRQ